MLLSCVNFIYIFCIFNDELMVDATGMGFILKLVIGLFIVFNFRSFLTFNLGKLENQLVLVFLGFCLVSFVVNFYEYNQPSVPIALIIASAAIYVVFSQVERSRIDWMACIAILCSVIYALLRPDTISEWSFRKTGGVADPNEFAVHCLMLIYFGKAFATRLQRPFLQDLALIAALTGLLIASSVSSFLTLGALSIIGLFYKVPVWGTVSPRRLLVVAGFCGICLVAALNVPGVTEKITQQVELAMQRVTKNDKNASSRLVAWQAGLLMTQAHPLIGVGPHRYMFAAPDYGTGWHLDPAAAEAHNMYIKVLAEEGVVALAVFLILLYRVLSPALAASFIPNRHYAFVLLSSLFMGMTLSLTFAKYFWFALALVQAGAKRGRG
jgi:O-antigen ligase